MTRCKLWFLSSLPGISAPHWQAQGPNPTYSKIIDVESCDRKGKSPTVSISVRVCFERFGQPPCVSSFFRIKQFVFTVRVKLQPS